MQLKTLTQEDVYALLPDRNVNSHKGDYGRILLLCGSRGYTGAAALSAMGALRVGAGLVYLGIPENIYEIEAVKLLEPIVFPLPDADGKLCNDAWSEIEKLLPKMDAVLFGPGIGQSEGTAYILSMLLEKFEKTLVIDADGINLLRLHIDALRGRTATTILTPHEGEFERLRSKALSDRIDNAVEVANDLGAIIVLKGHNTIITDGTEIFINHTGNPGMAVGGSGDVLAGMIAGLVVQGISPIQAAACSVWIHGAAGDICAEQIGQYGMLPVDMLEIIPRLIK